MNNIEEIRVGVVCLVQALRADDIGPSTARGIHFYGGALASPIAKVPSIGRVGIFGVDRNR